jgi:hypothetical protein
MHSPRANPAKARRLRPAAPAQRGAASGLLRLSQAAAQRLPSGAELAQWVQRASATLGAAGA